MTELNTVDPPLEAPTEDKSIRPFRAKVSDEALADLRRRSQATRWPDKETVADRSQGAQLAMLQEFVQYWGSGYDWRKAEAKLNALPQFVTSIDGLIYFNEADRGGHFAMWDHPELLQPSSGRRSSPYGSAASGGGRRA